MKHLRILSLVFILAFVFSSSISAITQEYEYKFQNYNSTFDFNNLTEVNKMFEVATEAGQWSWTKMGSLRGEKFLVLHGYADLRTKEYIADKSYTYSVDLKQTENKGWNAVFVRGVMPGNIRVTNTENLRPDGTSTQLRFDYFEWDYHENLGGEPGTSTIGGSGIGFIIEQGKFYLIVKAYSDISSTVQGYKIALPSPSGFDPLADYYNVTVTDDGKSNIQFFVNSAPVATVVCEEPGEVYSSDNYLEDEYFAKATIKDANGTVLKTIEKTRINSAGSQLAVTTRESELHIKNIKITTKTFDEQKPADTSAATDVVTGEVTGGDNAPAKTDNTKTIIIAVASVVIVAAVAVIVVTSLKKKI